MKDQFIVQWQEWQAAKATNGTNGKGVAWVKEQNGTNGGLMARASFNAMNVVITQALKKANNTSLHKYMMVFEFADICCFRSW